MRLNAFECVLVDVVPHCPLVSIHVHREWAGRITARVGYLRESRDGWAGRIYGADAIITGITRWVGWSNYGADAIITGITRVTAWKQSVQRCVVHCRSHIHQQWVARALALSRNDPSAVGLSPICMCYVLQGVKIMIGALCMKVPGSREGFFVH
jgi:hypothetical protein